MLSEQISTQSEQTALFKRQLDRFKRQLFGRKSEKQIIDNPSQGSLFVDSLAQDKTPVPATGVKGYRRKSDTKRSGDEVNDSDLRFDDSAPLEIIDVPAPELAEGVEIIDYKETRRLAQRPGSYVVLVYRRPVIKRKSAQTEVTSPAAVPDGCYYHVSLLAGLMVGQAVYHLPLYRQHRRMPDSGVKVSRATLISRMQKKH